jgi:hypothetical protein
MPSTCLEGYFIEDGTCAACTAVQNAATVTCTYADDSTPSTCLDGYYMVQHDATGNACEELVCETPADTTGYVVVDTNLNLAQGHFDVQAQCGTGYEGTASAVPCTSSGPYSLEGCTEIVVCTSPAETTGYTITAETDLLGA